MGKYKCNDCGYEFDVWFFKLGNTCKCPKCVGVVSQFFRFLKKLIKISILPAIALVILFFAARPLFDRIKNTALAAVDSSSLYAYSKDVYLDGLLYGQHSMVYYSLNEDTQYFSKIMSAEELERYAQEKEALAEAALEALTLEVALEMLESAETQGEDSEEAAAEEPKRIELDGVLSAGSVVRARSVIRRGEHVWLPVFFYSGTQARNAYLLLSRDWEEGVTEYAYDEKAAEFWAEYDAEITSRYELFEVAPEDEADFKERYNDYYKLEGFDGEFFVYAPRADRAEINAIYQYYLNQNNMDMVILQSDEEWVRPEFETADEAETIEAEEEA